MEVEFIQSVVLAVTPGGSPPTASSGNVVCLAPEGEKPGGVIADILEITAARPFRIVPYYMKVADSGL